MFVTNWFLENLLGLVYFDIITDWYLYINLVMQYECKNNIVIYIDIYENHSEYTQMHLYENCNTVLISELLKVVLSTNLLYSFSH